MRAAPIYRVYSKAPNCRKACRAGPQLRVASAWFVTGAVRLHSRIGSMVERFGVHARSQLRSNDQRLLKAATACSDLYIPLPLLRPHLTAVLCCFLKEMLIIASGVIDQIGGLIVVSSFKLVGVAIRRKKKLCNAYGALQGAVCHIW